MTPEEMLEALAEGILADGIEPTLDKALHQGIATANEGDVPGLDQLRDHLRSQQESTMRALSASLYPASLSNNPGSDLERLISSLSANSASFPGMLQDTTADIRARLEGRIQTTSPGSDPARIPELLDRILDLHRLEHQVRSVRRVEDIPAIDPEDLERLLGPEAHERLQAVAGSLAAFTSSGYIDRSQQKAALSARAVQKIGVALLQATLSRIGGNLTGDHLHSTAGRSHDLAGTSRDYQFGDPFDLDLGQSVMGAVRRQPGTPVQLSVRDLQIVDRETSRRATTVLAIDLSRSMAERGYLLAAKRLALSLSTFIRIRHPQDELLFVGFSESARRLQIQDLVALQWDRYGFGTNVHDALRLATGILGSHRGRQRNVVLITDGEPTAHRDPDGEIIFNHPPSEQTVARTFAQARRMQREGVYLCVCTLSESSEVTRFGQELARHAAGELIVTDPASLSADLFASYTRRRSF